MIPSGETVTDRNKKNRNSYQNRLVQNRCNPMQAAKRRNRQSR